ncbi:polygalacturonase inhibitor 1-like [Elaeis guineensis]|uniref:Polygalacturonase inhibitor 1-like n=1 Tax=Elaeis guineensis var. tenera TaxID=51953 RepID=A0A6I9SIB9_ELAGV|nr:polygalacturonase inhibitor 1-like [Elaeis guineensis]
MAVPTLPTFLLPLLFLLLSTTLSPVSSAGCDEGDMKALLNIKESLGNPADLSSWLPNTDCCNWSSIGCSENGRVYIFYLYALNVSSQIPSAIGELSALESLTLDTMPGLTGPIPPSFAKLSRLFLLQISDTSISGPVPTFLFRTNLSALTLSNNKLSGPIPPALSSLSYLRYLDLSGNSLTGTIPPGLLHGEYRFFILSHNKLTGEIPQSYGDGDVDTIDLGHNQLTGDPSFLFSSVKPMTKIDLSWNELEFDMTHVMFPHHLTYLDLSHNRIRGRVSKSFMDLNELTYLNLTYNRLCGEIPTGRAMVRHGAECYLHNKCLCGTPLPPCRNATMS